MVGHSYLILLSWWPTCYIDQEAPTNFSLLSAAYVWSPGGVYCKGIINLDLSEGRPICCGRLTVMSAARPEEGDDLWPALQRYRFVSRLYAGSLWATPERAPLLSHWWPTWKEFGENQSSILCFSGFLICCSLQVKEMNRRGRAVKIVWSLWWKPNECGS